MTSLDQLLARVRPIEPLNSKSFGEVENLYARQYLQRLAELLSSFEPNNPVLIGYNLHAQPNVWNIWVSDYKDPIREPMLSAVRALPSPIAGWIPVRDIYFHKGRLEIEITACNDTYALPTIEPRHRRSLSPHRRSQSPRRRSPSPHRRSPSHSPSPHRRSSRSSSRPPKDHSPRRSSRHPQDKSVLKSAARFILGT